MSAPAKTWFFGDISPMSLMWCEPPPTDNLTTDRYGSTFPCQVIITTEQMRPTADFCLLIPGHGIDDCHCTIYVSIL